MIIHVIVAANDIRANMPIVSPTTRSHMNIWRERFRLELHWLTSRLRRHSITPGVFAVAASLSHRVDVAAMVRLPSVSIVKVREDAAKFRQSFLDLFSAPIRCALFSPARFEATRDF